MPAPAAIPAPSRTLHFSTVAVGEEGVLIEGPSGSGKSDLALRLIDRGADLVSDDYTQVRPCGDRLIAAPPATIAGRIEVRGLGIVAMPFRTDVPVALLVRLTDAVERMPEPRRRIIAGIAIREIALEPFAASTPIRIELALRHGAEVPA